jgi:hypothetical protein
MPKWYQENLHRHDWYQIVHNLIPQPCHIDHNPNNKYHESMHQHLRQSIWDVSDRQKGLSAYIQHENHEVVHSPHIYFVA